MTTTLHLRLTAFAVFIILLTASYLLLTTGALPWDSVSRTAYLRISGTTTAWNALLDERIPRLIVLLCTGASLAVAGAVMQSLLQNPLAGPSILGLSSGSNLATLAILIAGWHYTYRWAIPLAAISGAFTVFLVLVALWRRRRRSVGDLLLVGIALSTLLLAVHTALLYAYRDHWQLIQTVTEWEAGSTYDRSWHHVHMQLPLAIVGLYACWYYRHELNILALGEEEALTLGVDVTAVRWRLILCVSLLTGGAAAALGSVPFFGLLLPHLLRQSFGANHRQLLPLCIFVGATTLVVFDALLRTFDIYFLTIGNLSALIGGIFFLILLRRHYQGTL